MNQATPTAQVTIIKWMKEGATLQEALERWQSITHNPLPEIIKSKLMEEINAGNRRYQTNRTVD